MNTQDLCDECVANAALYALGALPSDDARRFEQRVESGCPLCTAALADCSDIAGLLSLEVDPVAPPAEVRERLMASVQEGKPAVPPEMTLVRRQDSPWVRTPLRGVSTRPLLADRTILVRMDPGTVYPAHEHSLNEQCYVLEGSITDASGITVSAGDFVCMAAGSAHDPIRTDTGCVFLIAYTK